MRYAELTPVPRGQHVVLPTDLAMSNKSKHKDAAAKFSESFLSPKVQYQLSVALQGELPATFDYSKQPAEYKKYISDGAYWVGPLESKLTSGVPTITAGAGSAYAPQISQIVLTELAKVQSGSISVEQMLDNAQKSLEQVIK